MSRSSRRLIASLSLAATLLAGCGSGGGNEAQQAAPVSFSGATAAGAPSEVGTMAMGINRLKRHRFGSTSTTLAQLKGLSANQLQDLVNQGADVIYREGSTAIADVPNASYQKVKLLAGVQAAPIGPAEGTSIIENDYDPRYRTYTQLTSQLQTLAQRFPNLMTVQSIGPTWEKKNGMANRDLWMVRLSSNKAVGAKPGIIIMGCHHSRELVSSEIPLKLIEFLTENYGKDADVTKWLDSLEVWIIPMVNPDGHIKAEQGADWRKNTNGGTGVDLNRNYGYIWGGVGSSHDPDSDIYAGSAAFSEPETQAMRDFYRSHRNLKISLSYHSFSNLILFPWAHKHEGTPDKALMARIAGRMGKLSGYTPEQSSELYLHSGEANDWIYSEFKIPAFTAEVGSFSDGFDPPYASMDQFWKENLPMAKYLLSIAANPAAAN